MKYYDVALKPTDVSENVRAFVKQHQPEFIHLVKKLGVYILVLMALTFVTQHYATIEMEEQLVTLQADMEAHGDDASFGDVMGSINNLQAEMYASPYTWAGFILQLLIAYVYAVIAISWHRLVLLGPDHSEPMDIWSPQKHEKDFIFVLMLVSLIIPNVFNYLMISGMSTTPGAMGLAAIIFTVMFIYLSFKICFYFPARAVNSDMDMSTSFRLTKGYFWKLLWAYIRASIRVIGLLLLYYMVASMAIMPLVFMSGTDGGMVATNIAGFLIALPVMLYFQPLLTVLGVTVLSNYYQHAMQNVATRDR